MTKADPLRDPLTGTYSRATLDSRLNEEVARAERYGESMALLVIDLDDFKSINDAFGHRRGDQALVAMSERMQSVLRRSDLLFRFGGDEFIILLPNTLPPQAIELAERILSETRSRPLPGTPPVALTVSIGVALYPDDGKSAEVLFDRADVRVYAAKRAGRNRVISTGPSTFSKPVIDVESRLVERDQALAMLNRFLDDLPEKKRGVLVVTGVRGTGRSRFLMEVTKAATIRRYASVSLHCERALRGRAYGALLKALQQQELSVPVSPAEADFAESLQKLLRRESHSGILFAVDGLAELDWETFELLRWLLTSSDIPTVALAYTVDPEDARRSFPLEAPLRQAVELEPLSRHGVRTWLRHMLAWEAPREFSDWLFESTGGVPVHIEKGITYLVQRGIVGKSDGSWKIEAEYATLPLREKLDPDLKTVSHNLPVMLTSFVGRVEEIAIAKERLAQGRLLTVAGAGGMGKTRLALQTAAELIPQFTDGVFFVPLTTVESKDRLLAAIAEATRFSFSGEEDPELQLLHFLQEKRLLLVLDGFDQLLEAAHVVTQVLRAAVEVRILVTSREPLNVEGESVLRLRGLKHKHDRPEQEIEGSSAIQLFVQSARRVDPSFPFTGLQREQIRRISQLVEGMPLAIEIAASWVSTLDCYDIATEIERSIEFLATKRRDVPERHRSIRAVFQQSLDLLEEEAQNALVLLAVFRGGFRREAAERVTGASPPILSALVDKSLVILSPEGRYDLHELLRQYLEERPGQLENDRLATVRDAHAAYYGTMLDSLTDQLRGVDQVAALQRMEEELSNLQTGWNWVVEQARIGDIDRFVAPLSSFYQARGLYREGDRVFGEAMTAIKSSAGVEGEQEDVEALLAKLTIQQGVFSFLTGEYRKAEERLEAGVPTLRRLSMKQEAAHALFLLGDLAMRESAYQEARQRLEESLLLAREANDQWNEANALAAMAGVAIRQGKYDEAAALFREGASISREAGDPKTVARCLNGLGNVAYSRGEYARARNYYEDALVAGREVGDRRVEAVILGSIGNSADVLGDYERAGELYQECLRIAREVGNPSSIARGLFLVGHAHVRLNELEQAQKYLEESISLYRSIGERRDAAYAMAELGDVVQMLGDHAEARSIFDDSLSIFRDLGVLRGVASTLVRMSKSALTAEDYGEAAELLRNAVRMALEIQETPCVCSAILEQAKLLEFQGNVAKAVEFFAFVANRASGADDSEEADQSLKRLSAKLSEDVYAAAIDRGHTATIEEIAEEILLSVL